MALLLSAVACSAIPACSGSTESNDTSTGRPNVAPDEGSILEGDPGPRADADQDGDGLTVAEEAFFETSDFLPDTDFDGLSDFQEISDFGTDPTASDSDSDGLGDYDEVTSFGTLPTLGDTDFDGLSDFQEVQLYDTDPLSFDSDSDGVFDGEEIRLGTDPMREDTDGDGVSDFDELIRSTDPLDPNDPEPPIVPGDLFSFLTQDQADALRLMQAAGDLRAAQQYATCLAEASADCASRGTCGGGGAQVTECGCGKEGWELSIQEFEVALLTLLDQIDYAMTVDDRKEVADYMHESYDRHNPCWLYGGGVASCTMISYLCAW